MAATSEQLFSNPQFVLDLHNLNVDLGQVSPYLQLIDSNLALSGRLWAKEIHGETTVAQLAASVLPHLQGSLGLSEVDLHYASASKKGGARAHAPRSSHAVEGLNATVTSKVTLRRSATATTLG